MFSIQLNILISAVVVLSMSTCTSSSDNPSNATEMDTIHHQYTNALATETSPYLLQHAHNPVDWYPWGDKALEKAKLENKLLLISIGYAACHWCHVMEHESFEDTAVAKLMNDYFIPIKIDREERPDIDQIYMNAVQLMNQRGGWPLNCFATPDGKPFFGGTYFPKEQWTNILEKVHTEWQTNPDNIKEYANRLAEGIQQSEIIPMNTKPALFERSTLANTVEKWATQFDTNEGGPNRAPKFPIPNNYQFLLRYSHLMGDEMTKDYVFLTLEKMAFGGIYDQIGGGFARYSTDIQWKAPHFEKMLYDNGQLVSLYAEAYQATKNPLYKDIVYETIAFVQRELMSKEHAFYSSLDADSEGEEGKFYVWKKDELQIILGEDFNLFAKYYNVNAKGLWEHGNYILLRDQDEEIFAKRNDLSIPELREKMKALEAKVMEARDQRIRPGLDDKSLTSWNALMLCGLVDAYHAFGDDQFLDLAEKNAAFIVSKQLRTDGGLNHNYKQGRSTINGYLEDYCFTIEAFIHLYTATLNEKWLIQADELMQYTITHFYDEKTGMFFFTSDEDKALIARKTEVGDNVIPASNSSIAKGLFLLGHYLDKEDYLKKSTTMLNNVQAQISGYGSGYSNWAQLFLYQSFPFYEVAISGKDASKRIAELQQNYTPNKMILGAKGESTLPLMDGKYVAGETMIYVCENKACQLPVTEVKDAIKQLK
ncbi:thioredoxin domain-containing protein [Flavobacteriales bacterium]|nr:thioredoxin domain-containing protein [Flavobacteriales bacterium]